MRRPRYVTGTSPKHIFLSPGATPDLSTAPSRLSQPLIAPLYDGKSVHELACRLHGQAETANDYTVVREYWQSTLAD